MSSGPTLWCDSPTPIYEYIEINFLIFAACVKELILDITLSWCSRCCPEFMHSDTQPLVGTERVKGTWQWPWLQGDNWYSSTVNVSVSAELSHHSPPPPPHPHTPVYPDQQFGRWRRGKLNRRVSEGGDLLLQVQSARPPVRLRWIQLQLGSTRLLWLGGTEHQR